MEFSCKFEKSVTVSIPFSMYPDKSTDITVRMDRGEKTTMFSGQVSCGMSDKGTDMFVAVGDATANGYIRKRHVSLRRACQHSSILFLIPAYWL